MTRSLEQNKKLARKILLEKLDDEINGENSISNQRKQLEQKHRLVVNLKKEKLRKLKEEWKKREGLLPDE